MEHTMILEYIEIEKNETPFEYANTPNYHIAINDKWVYSVHTSSEVRQIISGRGLYDSFNVRSPKGLDVSKFNA